MPSKTIDNDMDYIDETFKRLDYHQTVIQATTFSKCRFLNCDFSETQFQQCRFIDCSFEHCTMKLIQVTGTTFSRCQFQSCDLIGVNWTEANWSDWATKMRAVEFHDCNLKYNVFLGLELPKLKMITCQAQEVNFAQADLTESDFADTDLTDAIFLRTTLTQASFVGAKNYVLNLNDNPSKGAKFSLPEALRLLYHLDIEIVDADVDD